MSSRRVSRPLCTIVTVLFGSLFALYLGEGVLRLFFHYSESLAPHPPFGDTLSHARFHLKQKEFSIDLNYNAQGFRDRDFREKLKAPRRILFLGDSFVEGFGVEENQRASNLLEQELNRDLNSPSYAVFNAGQMMSSPHLYLRNLARFGIAMKPEAVIVGLFMGNDFINANQYPVPKGYRVHDMLPEPLTTHNGQGGFLNLGFLRCLISNWNGKWSLKPDVSTSHYWRFFYGQDLNREFFLEQSGLTRDEFQKRLDRVPENVLHEFYKGEINPSYLTSVLGASQGQVEKEAVYTGDHIRNILDTLYEMYFICSQRKIPFLLVIFPSPYQVMPDHYEDHLKRNLGNTRVPQSLQELEKLNQILTQWLQGESIPYIDLAAVLDGDDYFLFDGHLNASGQRKAFQKILQNTRPRLNQAN